MADNDDNRDGTENEEDSEEEDTQNEESSDVSHSQMQINILTKVKGIHPVDMSSKPTMQR